MAKLIRSMSKYPPTIHWHIFGDDSRNLQYMFKWEVGSDVVTVKRLLHYGNGGIVQSTGESWGDPSVWEILPSWDFSGLKSMFKRDKQAAQTYVENFVYSYIKTTLGIEEWVTI